jgi:hypothetical protein
MGQVNSIAFLCSMSWIFFGACVSPEIIDKNLESWKGKDLNVVKKSWGMPDQASESKIVYHAENHGGDSINVNYLDSSAKEQITTHEGLCTVTFELDGDQKVKRFSWSGSRGRCYQFSANQR